MKSLENEFKETSAQVGYMLRWLKYQQENKGFVGKDLETTQNFIDGIKQCERWRDKIYKRKRGLEELKGKVASPHYPETEVDLRHCVGDMCYYMLMIGAVFRSFYLAQGNFPPMPPSTRKKEREAEEFLGFGFEYDPEKYA